MAPAARRRISRTCTRGRRFICRARVGSASIPPAVLLAGEGHIPLAATPDPSSAAPISGGLDECECEFHHEMKVTRIHESPRVTKPYTEEQWAEIEKLGHAIDADLNEARRAAHDGRRADVCFHR